MSFAVPGAAEGVVQSATSRWTDTMFRRHRIGAFARPRHTGRDVRLWAVRSQQRIVQVGSAAPDTRTKR
jgi:hypothetical protein